MLIVPLAISPSPVEPEAARPSAAAVGAEERRARRWWPRLFGRGAADFGLATFWFPLRKSSSVARSSASVLVTYEPPFSAKLVLVARNLTWRSGLPCEKPISLA